MSNLSEQNNLWIVHANGELATSHMQSIVAGFDGRNYVVQPWRGRPEPYPGVVVVTEVNAKSLELVEFASDNGRSLVFVLAAKRLNVPAITSLLKHGATDVLSLATTDSPIEAVVSAISGRKEAARRQLERHQAAGLCIGSSAVWRNLMLEVIETAWHPSVPFLLTGQSGTGKEGVARLIHQVSETRSSRGFVIVDCASLSQELSGSELFGHVKGAFTNAMVDRDGALHLANQGTLFLDEIGELPMRLQGEFLRVLQEKTYKPVGLNHWKKSDFRLVSATNRDLRAEVEAGRFRADLYYRISSGHHCHLPPLEERRTDIPELCSHFMRQEFADGNCPELAPETLDYLKQRNWPGNVRELSGKVRQMATRYCGVGSLSLGTLIATDRELSAEQAMAGIAMAEIESAIERAVDEGLSLKEIARRAEDTAIAIALRTDRTTLFGAATQQGFQVHIKPGFFSKENYGWIEVTKRHRFSPRPFLAHSHADSAIQA